jgi:23S rRNA (cytosine1962-C5)-methyltransferase
MYALLDSGNQQKLERFGEFTFVRPCAQALWRPQLEETVWQGADAYFSREEGKGWRFAKKVPSCFVLEWKGLKFKIAPTDFGHMGLFPEHEEIWSWAAGLVAGAGRPIRLLNLFAYSGAVTLSCAKAGAEVCHLDASSGMVAWARENAGFNQMTNVRWIVDDALKFLKREIRRGRRYEAIVLDPPTFGRGSQGEVFKIERDLQELLLLCRQLLAEEPLFMALTCHTPGMTPLTLTHLLEELELMGNVEAGELVIAAPRPLPSGCFARWIG